MKLFIIRNYIILGMFSLGLFVIILQKDEYSTSSTFKLISSGEIHAKDNKRLSNTNKVDNLILNITNSRNFSKMVADSTPLEEHFRSVNYFRNGFTSNSVEFHELFKKHVTVTYNENKETIKLDVNAYSPDASFNAHDKIIKALNLIISKNNTAKHNEELRNILNEILIKERDAQLAKDKLIGFEAAHDFLNPEEAIKGSVFSLVELQKQIKFKANQIKVLLTHLNPAAHEIVIARQELHALKNTAKKVGSNMLTNTRVKGVMAKHEKVMTEYKTELTNLKILNAKKKKIELNDYSEIMELLIIKKASKALAPDRSTKLKLITLLIFFCVLISAILIVFKRRTRIKL